MSIPEIFLLYYQSEREKRQNITELESIYRCLNLGDWLTRDSRSRSKTSNQHESEREKRRRKTRQQTTAEAQEEGGGRERERMILLNEWMETRKESDERERECFELFPRLKILPAMMMPLDSTTLITAAFPFTLPLKYWLPNSGKLYLSTLHPWNGEYRSEIYVFLQAMCSRE